MIDIFYSLEIKFQQFFSHNFGLNGNFHIHQNQPILNFKTYFFIYKINFQVKNLFLQNFVAVFFILKLLRKCSDFENSNDCIEKISSISIRNNLNLFETHILGFMKINFNVKKLDLCQHYLAVFLYACKLKCFGKSKYLHCKNLLV